MVKVIKRDGSVVDFDPTKIKKAICLAMSRTEMGVTADDVTRIAQKVETKIQSRKEDIGVEAIQDMVEKYLMGSYRKDAAREYIQYRRRRDIARQSKVRLMFDEIINTKANDVTRENANMNSDTPAGMMMKFASETTKPFVDNYLLSDEARDAVDNNYIHIHDKDYYPTKSLTCLQHPLDIIFKKGFRAGHGELRAPKRIETAATQACVSMETVQNEMHGGQAVPAFDFYLAPFVKMAYVEEVDKIRDLLTEKENEEYWDKIRNAEIKDYLAADLNESAKLANVPVPGGNMPVPTENRIIQTAINRTVDRVHQAMESFVHNMNNIHSRGGNQVVFSSINYGTDTSAEGRCIIREILRATEAGVGNGATAIFPIQIWKLKDGVSHLPEDPNYDLYQYACKVSARRFFPNFLNLDASYNRSDEWKADDPERYKHEVATMGALAGSEHLYVKIDGGTPIDISIKDFFNYCKTGKLEGARACQIFCTKETPEGYLNLEKNPRGKKKNFEVDSELKKIAGVYAITYLPEDVTYIGGTSDIRGRVNTYKNDIVRTGKITPEISFADKNLDNYKFEVLEYAEDYRDRKKKYLETVPNITLAGPNLRYYKRPTVIAPSVDRPRTRPEFKFAEQVPQDLINLEDRDIKVLDRDKKWTKVKHIFKNDFTNSPRMVHVHYLEDGRTYELSCTEDHPLFTGEVFTRADQISAGDYIYRLDGQKLQVTDVFYGSTAVDSYDIGTVTGTFIGSDIIMHNCRTRVWSDMFGPSTSVGRGNLSFTTINLPKLAIEASVQAGVLTKTDEGWKSDYSQDKVSVACAYFTEKLRKAVGTCVRQLDERYKFQASAKAKQFPLLMSGLWTGSEKLGPEDTIEPVIKHGTLGVGYIGLAEALVALTGRHHGESEESQHLGLQIIGMMDQMCKEASKDYQHNYSCFATPAEGLSGKFTKKDRKEFGEIPGVTDKDYYTNSNHVPVYYKCSAKHKAEVEGPYHKLTPAGHIFYVEVDGKVVKNPEAVQDIVDIAVKNDCGYISINYNCSRCEDCGYESSDEFRDGICPKCGSSRTTYLQRITGYLVGTTNRWNSAKQAELRDRVAHEGDRPKIAKL